MENQFDITIPSKKMIDISIQGKERIGISSNSITFERLGEPIKQVIPKLIKPKRKIRKIFIWSLLIQVSILITMEMFFRDYFFKVLTGWLIAVIGFILIPSIRKKKKEVNENGNK